MKEEDNILEKVAASDSFKVPDGYFENLTSELMNNLPEKEKRENRVKVPTMWTRMKPLFYMAALFIGAALIIRVASSSLKPSSDEMAVTAVDAETVSDQYIDAVVDRSMMDDYSLYVYLNDASAE